MRSTGYGSDPRKECEDRQATSKAMQIKQRDRQRKAKAFHIQAQHTKGTLLL